MTPKTAQYSRHVLLAAIGLVGCGGTAIPTQVCNVGRNLPYAVLYTLKADSTGCAAQSGQAAALNAPPILVDDSGNITLNPAYAKLNLWGEEAYYDDAIPTLKQVTVRPGEFAGIANIDPASPPTTDNSLAEGDWTDFTPDSQQLCTVQQFQPARNAGVVYRVSNFKTLNTPYSFGWQMRADLTYTDAAGCTAQYDVLGVYPAATCRTTADCNPGPISDNVAYANSSNPVGTAITGNFPVKCINNYCLLPAANGFPQVGPWTP